MKLFIVGLYALLAVADYGWPYAAQARAAADKAAFATREAAMDDPVAGGAATRAVAQAQAADQAAQADNARAAALPEAPAANRAPQPPHAATAKADPPQAAPT